VLIFQLCCSHVGYHRRWKESVALGSDQTMPLFEADLSLVLTFRIDHRDMCSGR
jgi:hypothetical protein